MSEPVTAAVPTARDAREQLIAARRSLLLAMASMTESQIHDSASCDALRDAAALDKLIAGLAEIG